MGLRVADGITSKDLVSGLRGSARASWGASFEPQDKAVRRPYKYKQVQG